MADKGFLIIQEQSDGSYNEIKLDPLASSVLAFDSTKNPTTILQSAFGGGGGESTAGKWGLQFDGTNNRAITSYNAAFYPQESFTIEFWFKSTADGWVLGAVDAAVSGWAVDVSPSVNKVVFQTVGGLSIANGIEYTVPSFSSGWHHAAFVYDFDNSLFYGFFDGVLIQSNACTGSLAVGANPFTIGNYGTQPWGAPGAILDEIRLSNVARYAANFVPPLYHPLDSNTIGYWRLDEGSGTTVYDSSGNGYGAIFSGTPEPTWAVGIGERALQFDGAQNYVLTPSISFSNYSNATIEGWFKTSNGGGLFESASIWGDSGSFGVYINNGGQNYIQFVGGSTIFFNSLVLNDNNWHHFALVQSNGSVNAYVDGAAVGAGEFSLADTVIGVGGNNPWYFDGLIDEVRISSVARYSSSFTPNRGFLFDSDTVLYWRMNEGEGTTVYDISGNGRNGTLIGNPLPVWVDEPDSYALQFDGQNHAIAGGFTTELDDLAEQTIEFWFKHPASSTGIVPISFSSKWEQSGGADGVTVIFVGAGTSANRIYVQYMMNGLWSGHPDASGDFAICDSNWHHFAIVWSGGDWTMFLDGVSIGTGTHPPPNNTSENADIGFGSFLGAVDEVRLSSVARYSAPFVPATSFIVDVNTIGYWKFDEGSGNSFADISGNNHNGTLTGSPEPTWITGV